MASDDIYLIHDLFLFIFEFNNFAFHFNFAATGNVTDPLLLHPVDTRILTN